jgi:hypothetical protein
MVGRWMNQGACVCEPVTRRREQGVLAGDGLCCGA